jgi:putative holliday junction resolvase
MSAMLGVDAGSVRIGVAVCERADLPAVPLTTIRHTSRAKDAAAIASLADERGASTIVVGYPLRLDGSRGPAVAQIDKLIQALRDVFAGEVVAVDERLTSAAAHAKLTHAGVKHARRKDVVDRLAAVEILETFRSTLNRGGA